MREKTLQISKEIFQIAEQREESATNEIEKQQWKQAKEVAKSQISTLKVIGFAVAGLALVGVVAAVATATVQIWAPAVPLVLSLFLKRTM